MLVVAVKNTILVVLIILIFHFLLKTFDSKSDIKQTFIEESFAATNDTPSHSLSLVNTPMITSKQNIDSYIDEPIIVKKPEDPSTCGPVFNEMESTEKEVKSDCVDEQPNPNAFLLLKTYEDENPMNNDKWLDNIDLYDEFSSHLSSYQCSKFEVDTT